MALRGAKKQRLVQIWDPHLVLLCLIPQSIGFAQIAVAIDGGVGVCCTKKGNARRLS